METFRITEYNGRATCTECGHGADKWSKKCSNLNCRTNTPTELVACPFCGACDVYDDLIGPDPQVWVVYCPKCGARGPFGETREAARRLWSAKK